MDVLTLKAGSQILIGSPSKPVDSELTDKLRDELALITEITEAHLPNMYAAKIFDPPRQVLITIFENEADKQVGLKKIEETMDKLFSTGDSLDVLPMFLDDELLQSIRDAKCKLK